MLFSPVFSLQISLTLHRKSDGIYLYLSIEVLYEEKEIELDCLNNEIDAINLAFDLGFRLIEIKPSLIRLKGTTSMLDLRKIMNFKEDSLFPFFFINIDDSIIADQYFKESLIYKKDKFDLITDILKRNNVNFHY